MYSNKLHIKHKAKSLMYLNWLLYGYKCLLKNVPKTRYVFNW